MGCDPNTPVKPAEKLTITWCNTTHLKNCNNISQRQQTLPDNYTEKYTIVD